ncbi:MAG: hypothetical protein KC643_03755 [Nitrospira sp.]|nr:hypothetical protein [Nitrospira sp.]
MNSTQSEPRSTIFCLTGILAALLLMTGFLTDGNAHTGSVISAPSTLAYHDDTNDDRHLFQTMKPNRKDIPATLKKHPQREEYLGDSGKEDHPNKKRMGLALLFLGMLAEES